MKYKFGDIVIISFPFVGLEVVKKRPALILLDSEDDDVIVARITSQSSGGKYSVIIDDWQKSGLLLPSFVKLNKIATLNKSMIFKQLQKLTSKDFKKVRNVFNRMWEE